MSTIVQLVKQQLQADEARLRSRAAAEGEDEDEEGDEADAELESEVLTTICTILRELLRMGGVTALPTIEAQILPHFGPWLQGSDATRQAFAIGAFTTVHGRPCGTARGLH